MFGGRCSAVWRHPSCGRSLNGSTFNDRNRTGYVGRMRHPVFRGDRHLSRPLVGRVENNPAKWESHSATSTFGRNRTIALYPKPVRCIVTRFFGSKWTRPPAEHTTTKLFVRITLRAARQITQHNKSQHSTTQYGIALRYDALCSHPPFPSLLPLLFEFRNFQTDINDSLRSLFF